MTGFMASGKSTVGPRVAERLGLDFVDLDAQIEAQAGRSIPVIFEHDGEAAFRQWEAEALRATADRSDVVVALGGGALADTDNLQFARARGTVIYLRVPADELLRRLKHEADERPLLQDELGEPLSEAAMRAKIERMLCARRSFYEQADVAVAADQPVEKVVAAVVESVR